MIIIIRVADVEARRQDTETALNEDSSNASGGGEDDEGEVAAVIMTVDEECKAAREELALVTAELDMWKLTAREVGWGLLRSCNCVFGVAVRCGRVLCMIVTDWSGPREAAAEGSQGSSGSATWSTLAHRHRCAGFGCQHREEA